MTYEQLVKRGIELGLEEGCAKEMAKEHLDRQDEIIPKYVRMALNSANPKINCKKTQKFLDRKFGFNTINVHDISGMTINRHKITNSWYVT